MARLECYEEEASRRPLTLRGLDAKVAFLRRADSYPEPTTCVEAIETHMSWLFLTDRHAYKLKKPVRRNDIDGRTLAMRQLGCRRELRLNRRLAPDVYLDMVALTVDPSGRMAIDGAGRCIDWLVRMRRLPAELTLEHQLQAGRIGVAQTRRIVERLAPFFAAAARARMAPIAYRRKLSKAIAAAAAQLARTGYGLERREIDAIAAALNAFIATRGDLLDARVRAGRIVEGHGDLRPEHIYLTTPPTIIDCIEFERDLRLHDPVDELAFLAMECDRCGRPELDGWLFDAYRERVGDDPPRALIEFHKAFNAFKRARIAIWHIDDQDTGPRQQWVDRANDYLRHARRYLGRINPGPRAPQ